ncbi:MAG: LysR family transcriptional regulator [Alphaproteobacteria bacterium]|nr:LysR family transcriptional regulator [Alphaproteobacteria bacterium]
MNLKQLEAFLAISRHGGFIEAAERLNLTQSTISARIKELEQDLGVLLFDRSRRQIQLTPKGRELLDYAQQAVALQREIKQQIGSAESISGVFRIGVAELIAVTWLPQFVANVREQYPAVTLQFEVTMNPTMLEGLRSGSLDLALMIHTGSASDLMAQSLGSVPFAWMAGVGFKLPRGILAIDDLKRLPIIYQSADSFMNHFMSSMLHTEGANRRSGTSCNSLAARVSLISAGLGVSLMPLNTLKTAPGKGRLRMVPTNPPQVNISYEAVCAKTHSSAALRRLMELAVQASSFTRGARDSL